MKKSECEMRSSKVNMYRVDKKMIKKICINDLLTEI
jgi:hypothetical protein